ncbi:MAG: hypothetical protein ACPG8V_04125 [Alphaproteobacteria bacterium]
MGKIKKKVKENINSDNVIDLSVDIGLILIDAINQPIIIAVRFTKFLVRKIVSKYLKKLIKKN